MVTDNYSPHLSINRCHVAHYIYIYIYIFIAFCQPYVHRPCVCVQVYNGAVIGLCITISTWLTVVMAVSRYLAICRPLHARSIIGMRFTVGTIVAAVVISVVLNAPRFLYDEIACVELPTSAPSNIVGDDADDVGRRFYFPFMSYLRRHAWIDQAYHASYLVVGILTPLAVLAYCNFFLIRAIRRSLQLRRQFQQQAYGGGRFGYAGRAAGSRNFVSASEAARTRQRQSQQQQQQQQQHRNSTNPPVVVILTEETSAGGEVVGDQCRQRRQPSNPTTVITLTMTIIVIMNVVMVTPSEISNVFTAMMNAYLHQSDTSPSDGESPGSAIADGQSSESQTAGAEAYNIAIAVTNTLQTLNFACNFVLYCVVNVQFRRIMRMFVTCRSWWGPVSNDGGPRRSAGESVTVGASPSIGMARLQRRGEDLADDSVTTMDDFDGTGRRGGYRSSTTSAGSGLSVTQAVNKYAFLSGMFTTGTALNPTSIE